jgi:uncharacterized protein YbjT (DUF2867 family)
MEVQRKKVALVVGASGLVGHQLVDLLLESPAYSEVIILLRRPFFPSRKNLREIVFDFENPDASVVLADDVFCCLGTTMKRAGSKDAFRKVDYTYPLAIAELALKNGAQQFLIVTAMGANSKSLFFYNRVKGELEEELLKLNYPRLKIVRPSLLLGQRQELRMGEKLGELFLRSLMFMMIGPLKKYSAIESAKVARAMVALAQEKSGNKIERYDSGVLQQF